MTNSYPDIFGAQSSAITDTTACFQYVLDRTPQNLTVIAPKPFLNPYYQFSLSHVSACGEGFVKRTPSKVAIVKQCVQLVFDRVPSAVL